MGLETATYISGLNSSNPVGASDPKSQGDDHIRLIKSTILASFPNITGAMTASHTELNVLDGATLSTAELNKLDGVTASTAELNHLDGVTTPTGSGALVLASSPTIDTLTVTTSITLPSASIADAALSSNVPLLNQTNTFTSDIVLSETFPVLRFVKTDGGSNAKNWGVAAATNEFSIFTALEASPTSAATKAIGIQRSGTTVVEVELNATLVDINGMVDISGTLAAGNSIDGAGSGASRLALRDTSAGSDEKRWVIRSASGQLQIQAYTDADAFGANAVRIFRSGTSVTEVELSGTTLDFNGNPDISGTLTTPNSDAAEVGFKGAPKVAKTANYTLQLSDAGKQIHFSGHAGVTLTIPANSSVAFPVGTVIPVVNFDSNSTLTVAITSDSLYLAGVGSTGSCTLAEWGMATLVKIGTTQWMITGTGLT